MIKVGRISFPRDREFYDGATFGAIGGGDRASMCLDDAAAYRQAQADSAPSPAGLGTEELLKDTFLSSSRQPGSVIHDLHRKSLFIGPCDNFDRTAGRRVFHRIVDQLDDRAWRGFLWMPRSD